MNRAAALLLALAVAAAGLGYVLLQTPGGGDATTDAAASGEAASKGDERPDGGGETEPATLAEVDALARDSVASVGGTLDRWSIVPMNTVGQSWQNARISASRGADTLAGVGSATFEDVEAGAWDVVVEVDGQPTWRRTVDLPAGRSETTYAYVGEQLRVAGRLVDATESPIGGEYVHFIPRGIPLPTMESFRTIAGTQPGKTFEIGPIEGVRTASSGRFRFTLPSAGEYRVAVGRPGELRWVQRDLFELSHGGPDHVDVVVPRSASLEVRFDGRLEDRPTTITAYLFDPELAQRIESERLAPGTGRASVQDAQGRIKRERGDQAGAARERPVAGGADKLPKPLAEANRETFDRNMEQYGDDIAAEGSSARGSAPLFQPGWRPTGTARFNGDGVALFEDLPHGEALRFLIVRARERATTPVALQLAKERHSVGRLTLGSKLPETSNRMERNENAAISVSLPEDQAEAPLEIGAHWSIEDR